MNTIKSMLIFFVISTALIVFSCVPVRKTIDASDAVKQFFGDWINPENEGLWAMKPQRYVIEPGNKIEIYGSVTDAIPSVIHQYTVLETWIDRNGNTYAMVRIKCLTFGGNFHALWKIDKSGKEFEMNLKSGNELPPETIVTNPDPSPPDWIYYMSYYRK